MHYDYFISYNFGNGGIGNCNIDINHKIKNMNDIANIENALKSKIQFKDCVILNYILLRKSLFKFRK